MVPERDENLMNKVDVLVSLEGGTGMSLYVIYRATNLNVYYEKFFLDKLVILRSTLEM